MKENGNLQKGKGVPPLTKNEQTRRGERDGLSAAQGRPRPDLGSAKSKRENRCSRTKNKITVGILSSACGAKTGRETINRSTLLQKKEG